MWGKNLTVFLAALGKLQVQNVDGCCLLPEEIYFLILNIRYHLVPDGEKRSFLRCSHAKKNKNKTNKKPREKIVVEYITV